MFCLVFVVLMVSCKGGKKNEMREISEPLNENLGTSNFSQSTEVGTGGTGTNAIISTPGSPSHTTTVVKTFDFALQITAISGTIYTL
jgi:hypothetical protein